MDNQDNNGFFVDKSLDDIYDDEYFIKQITNFGVTIEDNFTRLGMDWERRRSICVLQVICYIVHALHLIQLLSQNVHKPIGDGSARRDRMRQGLMQQLLESENSRDIIGMGPGAFLHLCEKLRGTGRVKDSVKATVEEQVERFLHILTHNVEHQTVSFFFHDSGEIISQHFHSVLRAVISLWKEFLVQPSRSHVPPQILHSSKYYPYFADCIGVVDGTHIRVKVPRESVAQFKGKKRWPTQNVLAACDFGMNFTYVLAGWEGTALDSKVLKNALDRENKLKLIRGKFYLGDAGFQLKSGLLTPYRGVRYHLKDYCNHAAQNAKELFNLRHASLRNVIERAFGVLKKRFPIITDRTEPHYSFQTMTEIVLACCILHNFLMREDPNESLIDEVDRELLQSSTLVVDDYVIQIQDEDYREGVLLRDNIAAHMWADYES